MDAAELIARLDNARWRALLVPLLDPDQKVRDAAFSTLGEALRQSKHERTEVWEISGDVPRLIEIGMTVRFPPLTFDWNDAAHEIMFWFVSIKHPWLARTIATHFAAAGDTARLDAITILAAQRNDEALRLLGELIEQHGMPIKMYSRFFWELNDSYEYADYLLPQLILKAGRYMPNVVDFVNVVNERGKLSRDKLVPALPLAAEQAAELLAQVQVQQQRAGGGTRWRFKDDYVELSHSFGAYLDLLSLIPGAPTETIQRAQTLADPRLLSIATSALLRCGIEPPPGIGRAAAESHVVRQQLYRMLEGFGRVDLFPAELATFEAFAASHMAGWLAYPTELGYEPEALVLAATVRGTNDDGERQWCLWKFEDADGKAFAGVSGPYELEPRVGPLEGRDVFSNFAEWDSATPERHLESVLATLKDWRLSCVI